jgi:Flp pilus assembly protein TadG
MPPRSSRAPTADRSREPGAGRPRHGTRQRGESGTSAVEFSIVAPIFLLTIFVIIQGALYLFATDTAQSSAREGVSYLRLAGNNSDPNSFVSSAEDLTEAYASKIGRLKNATAVGSIDTKTGRVTMVVVGEIAMPLGGEVEVQQSASATLEQFRGDTRDSP